MIRDNVTLLTATPIAETAYTDDTIAVIPSTHTYKVEAVNGAGTSNPSPQSAAVQVTNSNCSTAAGLGTWRTEQVCGTWEIISPNGTVTYWNAANIKDDSIGGTNGLDGADIDNFKDVFDTVRVALRWDRLQPSNATSLDSTRRDQIKDLLDDLNAKDVDVILDVVHLSGNDKVANAFSIPGWAWTNAGYADPATRTKANSYSVWAGSNNDGAPLHNYLDLLDSAGILTHNAVIAVEVVNEPHPLNQDALSAAGQQRLAQVHDALIAEIRTHDPDMLVVVGAYFGGTRHGGTESGGTYQWNYHGSEITHDNVVWTAHNYFTGVGDNEGANDGQRNNGQRDEGVWSEGFTSAGCYGNTSGITGSGRLLPWTCSSTPNNRATAQAGHRLNAFGHWQWAQDNDMPFFMGEWGIGRQRYQLADDNDTPANPADDTYEYRGWDLADYFFCDKLAAYDDIDNNGTRISWAVWSLDANTDAFGLYNARNDVWNVSHRSYLTENAWASAGTFGAESAGWNLRSWTFAQPFENANYCAALN